MAGQWAADGAGKWVAYDLGTGELVGRGGLSPLGPENAVTGRIASLFSGDAWLADRLELGWTVRSELWGRGMRPRSAGLGWSSRSLTWGPGRSWPSPSGTITGRGR